MNQATHPPIYLSIHPSISSSMGPSIALPSGYPSNNTALHFLNSLSGRSSPAGGAGPYTQATIHTYLYGSIYARGDWMGTSAHISESYGLRGLHWMVQYMCCIYIHGRMCVRFLFRLYVSSHVCIMQGQFINQYPHAYPSPGPPAMSHGQGVPLFSWLPSQSNHSLQQQQQVTLLIRTYASMSYDA